MYRFPGDPDTVLRHHHRIYRMAGNRYLLFTLQSYFNWFNHPMRKIGALLLVIPFYTIPISVLLLTGWYHLFLDGLVNWNTLLNTTLIILIAVIFIVHVYETVFLVKESTPDNWLLPPISLQLLMENAIKHNEFSRVYPLTIVLRMEGEKLVMTNEVGEIRTDRVSNGLGLANLAERYRLISSKNIDIIATEREFTVRLPLLPLA